MALARCAIGALKEAGRLPVVWMTTRRMTIEIEKFKDKETAEEVTQQEGMKEGSVCDRLCFSVSKMKDC